MNTLLTRIIEAEGKDSQIERVIKENKEEYDKESLINMVAAIAICELGWGTE